jgi:lipoprotein signal peptidase
MIIVTCIGSDQATKLVAKEYLRPDALISFAGDTFRLQYAENTGAFLSLGSSLPEHWRQLIFTIFVGVFSWLAALRFAHVIYPAIMLPPVADLRWRPEQPHRSHRLRRPGR